MPIWFTQLKDKIKEIVHLKGKEPYCIGVSGGRDSVFLFHLIKEVLPPEKIMVLHLNHGLRGELSDRDQSFVESLCLSYKVPCKSVKVKLAKKGGDGGLENNAREVRYRFFHEKMKECSSPLLFCGHTLDDYLETILMKIHRGSGLAGLKGIATNQIIFGVSVCRPLLQLERHLITEYLESHHLQWCDDHTNESLEYFRNKIRLLVMPKLTSVTKERLIRLSIFSQILQANFQAPEAICVAGGLEFDFGTLQKLSNFELRFCIEKIFHYFGFSSGPDKVHMERISAFLENKKSHIQLPKAIHLYCSREKVFFINENGVMPPQPYVDKNSKNRFLFENLKLKEVVEMPVKMLSLISWRWVDFERDDLIAKLVKKILSKLKIPTWRKKRVPLCEIDGEILFIAYLGVTDKYKNLISSSDEFVTIDPSNNKIGL